jgi:hypothetical protein
MMLDDFTPVAVWREYHARKAHLDCSPRRYHEEIERIADELGCGIPPDELTEQQRAAQQQAVRKWEPGCRA